MKKLQTNLMILAILTMAGCSTNSEGSLEVAFSTAIAGAIAYDELPPCGKTTQTFCSKRDIVLKIKDSKESAYQALKVARAAQTSDSIAAAQQAVAAFNAVLSMPEVQSAIKK